MAKDVRPVDLESDTFKALKRDMTAAVNGLIGNMIEFRAEKAAVAVKQNVELKDCADGAILPKFSHKVSCTVQKKDEREGEVFGVYTLQKAEDGTYFLRQEQTDLFEEA
ncbi:MAG: hypothetical protein IKN00_04125 [Bacteroidales bacterium]|nr:hypothetical protein [Bacteroidales bacterium]